MQSITPSTGDPIKARCTKCRKNTDHVVITMSEEGPVNVQCKICSRQHHYRPPTAEKKPAVRQSVQPRDAECKEWQDLRPRLNGSAATDYSMTSSYKVKDLIDHPVFGIGIVQRVAGPQKIEVLFEAGKKMMRCK
ncbi:MAG: hypothetical protein R2940_06900 [Syntrophotaleaceae bacterium]